MARMRHDLRMDVFVALLWTCSLVHGIPAEHHMDPENRPVSTSFLYTSGLGGSMWSAGEEECATLVSSGLVSCWEPIWRDKLAQCKRWRMQRASVYIPNLGISPLCFQLQGSIVNKPIFLTVRISWGWVGCSDGTTKQILQQASSVGQPSNIFFDPHMPQIFNHKACISLFSNKQGSRIL